MQRYVREVVRIFPEATVAILLKSHNKFSRQKAFDKFYEVFCELSASDSSINNRSLNQRVINSLVYDGKRDEAIKRIESLPEISTESRGIYLRTLYDHALALDFYHEQDEEKFLATLERRLELESCIRQAMYVKLKLILLLF